MDSSEVVMANSGQLHMFPQACCFLPSSAHICQIIYINSEERYDVFCAYVQIESFYTLQLILVVCLLLSPEVHQGRIGP